MLNSSIQQQQQPIHPQPIQQNPQQQSFNLLQQQIPSQHIMAPKLIAPTMFQASNNEEKMLPQQQFRPEPLTHNQLAQALNYLLENDPDFIRKVHEAYIKSFNKKISH